MALDMDTIVTRDAEAVATPVDNELVILNMAGNNYMTLDDIGRRIWELLATPMRVDDLCARLAGEYAGERKQIDTDVLAFLKRLAADRLVHIHRDWP